METINICMTDLVSVFIRFSAGFPAIIIKRLYMITFASGFGLRIKDTFIFEDLNTTIIKSSEQKISQEKYSLLSKTN